MRIIACFGPVFSFEGLLVILGFLLAIEGTVAFGIAFVISHIFKTQKRKVLAIEAAALLGGAASGYLLGWEGAVFLTLIGAFACGCLLVVIWLFNLTTRGRSLGADQEFCFLELTDRTTSN